MENGEGAKKPLGRSLDSLGWLAQSSVQPKKRKEIEGNNSDFLFVPNVNLLAPLRSKMHFRLTPPPPSIPTGVTASSLLGLKAQVAKKQQEATDLKEGRTDLASMRDRSRGVGLGAVLERRNAGVAERDQKDKLELKVRHLYALHLLLTKFRSFQQL